MINDKINVRFFDIGLELTTLKWPLKGLEYVEELVFNILETKGVGPVYRLLFGLRFTDQPIWLAPNIRIQDLLKLSNKFSSEPILELRMRYRPSSYTKLIVLDKTAFEIIFAQIRFDFINTKFTNEKRDFILLNDSVLGLIATDLLRHALEHDIDINEIFRRVNPDDFIPRRASKWQRSLLFHLREKLNLQKSIQIGFRNCDRDVLKTKQGFVELFLQDVCKDYGVETYKVVCVDNPSNPQPMEIRIRYNQTSEDSFCVIENRLTSHGASKMSNNWAELCDIYSICYGTLRHNAVEINRSNGRPFRVTFETSLHAKSFLSLIDGYYRLMRKWHFNFCRDVSSPDLDHLKKIKSHGPIGYETMRLKLSSLKKPGTFLIRRCMEKNNRYMIDVLLQSKVRLTIDIDWDPSKKIYTKVEYAVNRDINITIIMDRKEYSSLKNLINDIQIKLDEESIDIPPLQLKYWLPPSEYDDCPALLLSIPKKKFKEFDFERENRVLRSITELPRFIPPEMIQFSNKLPLKSNNRMIVRLANINSEQNVIVKDHIDDNSSCQPPDLHYLEHKDFVLNLCHKGHSQVKFFNNLKPAQIRLADWVFVKNPLFAETIGLDLTRNSLIQEHLPLGQLDKFLAKSSLITEVTRRSILCQLAHALLFLQEKRIIHGKFRCHNIFIKNLDPIQIKITDPLGTFDTDRDRAFLPPEYFGLNGQLSIREYDPGIDAWAFGTTLWQIYSRGCRPPAKRYANTLIQPSECPDQMWRLIESCWIVEPACRASPQTIYRDLNDSFAWERETHNYDYISHANVNSGQNPISLDSTPMTTLRVSCTSNSESNGSGGSSNGSGSQMNLLPSRINALLNKTTELNKIEDNMTRVVHSATQYDNSLRLKKSTSRAWKSIMLFKNGSMNNNKKTDGYDEYRNGSSVCSRMSDLSTCSTPSRSEVTKSTELIGGSQSDINEFDSSVWQIDSSRLKLGTEIGRGSCGVVIKGVLLQWGGLSEQVVAIKCINRESSDFSRIDDLKREFEILKNLNHNNIVKTLGFVDEACMMLVVEYMPLGSLLSCLKNSHHDHLLSLPLQKYASDIAKGMEYLESMKIVHRDLALRNILVKNQNEVKICDFGLAQFLGSSGHYKLKTDRALPLRWYAPEALDTWTFSHKTDVWSYGIVLWEIYSGGSNPQYSGTYADLSDTLKHERLLMPKDCPEPMYELMLSCWAYNPDDRESFSQICDRLENFPDTSSSVYQGSTEDLID